MRGEAPLIKICRVGSTNDETEGGKLSYAYFDYYCWKDLSSDENILAQFQNSSILEFSIE